ncbi:MAG: HDIG domain-containing protein [Methanoregulaceae archaeon]|nr:HDIG domain-containing protein [Methanoregulaceae archaeon]
MNGAERYVTLLERAGCDAGVIAHSQAVHEVAIRYADRIPLADRELVSAGAYLHDIGRGKTHTIQHAQVGADYCRSIGLPEPVARIVECHTGAGLTADECTLLGLPPRDCVPATLEEKIVCNSDNLVAGAYPVSIERTICDAFFLPRHVRSRIFWLWLELESYR